MLKHESNLLEGAVVGVASHKWMRWLRQRAVANELNRVQTRMFAVVLKVMRRPALGRISLSGTGARRLAQCWVCEAYV